MHAILGAVEARDHDAIDAQLADDVSFTGPAVARAYVGKALTSAILRGVDRIFSDLRYTRSVESADGRDIVLVFEASVGGTDINGCDLLHVDEDGKIDDIVVMVRPLSAAKDLSAALGSEFRQILADAAQS